MLKAQSDTVGGLGLLESADLSSISLESDHCAPRPEAIDAFMKEAIHLFRKSSIKLNKPTEVVICIY